MQTETSIRDYFLAWQKGDWGFVESALAPGFTFTSPYDDHIGEREYKQKCWDSIKEIGEFEFVAIIEKGNEAFVRYKGRVNGISVQNAEHFTFEGGKIRQITVFFGRPEDQSQGGDVK